jgi:hypothetical protein
VDLREFSSDKVEEEIACLCGKELAFNSDKGLLLEPSCLFKMMQYPAVTMHYIISDGGQCDFRSELAALYEAFSQGLRLCCLTDPITDFACGENGYWKAAY